MVLKLLNEKFDVVPPKETNALTFIMKYDKIFIINPMKACILQVRYMPKLNMLINPTIAERIAPPIIIMRCVSLH